MLLRRDLVMAKEKKGQYGDGYCTYHYLKLRMATSLLNFYVFTKMRFNLIFQNFNNWGVGMQSIICVVYL
jgi:hypothetical protein